MENENKSSKFHINLWYFIIFSLLGLITENIVYVIMSKTIGARGLYLGPLCFIYGISSVILINALEKLKNKKIKLFIISIILVSLMQYAISFILEGVNGSIFWNYSKKYCNLNGRICLAYSLVFTVIVVVFMLFIKKYFDKLINKMNGKRSKIVDIILTVIITLYILSTVWGFVVYSRNAKEVLNGRNYISNNNIIEKIENIVFTNERMNKIFPNLRIMNDEGTLIYASSILEK